VLEKDKRTYKLTREIPDTHLAEIGRVVVEWSFLEEVVNLGIAGLLSLPIAKARLITGPIRGFRQRLQILRSLAELTLEDKDDRAAFKDVFKAVEDAYAESNRMAHAVWWGLEDDDARALQFVTTDKPLNDLGEHHIHLAAIKVRSATDALTRFLTGPENSYRWPGSSPTKR
jgi:hypothetical protein